MENANKLPFGLVTGCNRLFAKLVLLFYCQTTVWYFLVRVVKQEMNCWKAIPNNTEVIEST